MERKHQILLSSRSKEKEPKKHSKNSNTFKEQLGNENRWSKEAELPSRSFATKDPNVAVAVEQGSLRTRKTKGKLDSNQPNRRQKRTDTTEQANPATNNFFPENSGCPDHVSSSNIPNQPRAEKFELSQVTQKFHGLHAPQHVHPETTTACGSLVAGIGPHGTSFSSADCETPSSSNDESDIIDYETDSTDTDPRPESIPEQKVADLKQIIVDRIMKDFCSTFYKSEGIRMRGGNHGGDSNHNNESCSRNTSNHAPSTQIHNMQALIQGGGGRGNRFGDEDNDGNQDQHTNFNFTPERPDTLKLACPYYKRDPSNRAHHRSCRGSSWPTFTRTK